VGRAEDNKRDKRERILRAGRELFGRHGYAGTTMDEVAALAGVSKGALYFHAGSKVGLLNQVFGADFTAWIDEAFAADRRRRNAAIEDRVVRVYGRLLELMCDQPELTRVYMANAGAGEGREHPAQAMQHLLSLTAGMLDDAKQRGELVAAVGSHELAYNLWALYYVEQHRWLLDHPGPFASRAAIEGRLRRPFAVQLAGYLTTAVNAAQ
jgi:AcrR family transcriptional regulator